MAEKELVIKISEKMYKWVNNANKNLDDYNASDFWELIKNGIPLPAGHGDLIDCRHVTDAIEDWINAGEYRYTNATYYLKKRIANITPTIEADYNALSK